MKKASNERACVLCGCTDSKACVGAFREACYWICQSALEPKGLCSMCASIIVTSLPGALAGARSALGIGPSKARRARR